MPKNYVIYVPFPAQPRPIKNLGDSFVKQLNATRIFYNPAGGGLATLNTDTKLYVVCHCESGSDQISDNGGNSISYLELASRIHKEGLSKQHKVMKLYACQGAINTFQGLSGSFADNLRRKLWDLGYTVLTLYAYSTTVTSVMADGHRYGKRMDTTTGQPLRDEKGNILYERASTFRRVVPGQRVLALPTAASAASAPMGRLPSGPYGAIPPNPATAHLGRLGPPPPPVPPRRIVLPPPPPPWIPKP